MHSKMECGCTEDDFITVAEIPVLDPPPGFEDCSLVSLDDRFYDDPYSEEEDFSPKPVLNMCTVSRYASELAHSLLVTVVKPKVKLRTKKPVVLSQQNSLQSECEVYSLPIDSLTHTVKQKQNNSYSNRHSIAVPKVDSSEPVHMTLEEVRTYLREFQDTSLSRRRPWMVVPSKSVESPSSESKRKSCFVWTPHMVSKSNNFDDARTKRSRKSLSVTAAGIKQALFSVFRIPSNHHLTHHHGESCNQVCPTGWTFSAPESKASHGCITENSPYQRRALPPVPQEEKIGFVRVPCRPSPTLPPLIESRESKKHLDLVEEVLESCSSNTFEMPVNASTEVSMELNTNQTNLDFAASIEAVKDHGWVTFFAFINDVICFKFYFYIFSIGVLCLVRQLSKYYPTNQMDLSLFEVK